MRSLALFLLPVFVSCTGDVRGPVVDIAPKGWLPEKSYEIVLHNDDTVSRRDLYVFMLHKSDLSHEYHALPLSVTVIAPDSTYYTSELVLRPTVSQQDNWNKLWWIETRVQYRLNAVLSQTGYYRFVVSNTSAQTIYGVRAIGIEIRN